MKRTFRQLIVFTFFGVVSATVDFGSYLVLTRFVPIFSGHYIVASVISATLALVVGFYNNRRWTFRAAHLRAPIFYVRFFTVYIVGIGWQNLLLYLLVTAGFVDWLAKAAAILAIAYGWNFVLAKYWVFRYD